MPAFRVQIITITDPPRCPDGAPYAIIVDGEEVREVKLGFGPGRALQRMVTVESNAVQAGKRIVKLSRALAGVTAEHYSFDLRGSTLLFINARGAGRYTAWPNPGYVASKLTLLRADGPTCACDLGVTGRVERFDRRGT